MAHPEYPTRDILPKLGSKEYDSLMKDCLSEILGAEVSVNTRFVIVEKRKWWQLWS